MTAKSRRRKLIHRLTNDEGTRHLFTFNRGANKQVQVIAVNEEAAKRMFQERYGYWPE